MKTHLRPELGTSLGSAAALLLLAASLPLSISNTQATIFFVRTNGNDTWSGTNWVEAKLTVAAAISRATGGDEIWVARGTYPGHLTLKPDLALYGGFAGTEAVRDQRDWTNQLSVLWGTTNQAPV